ncbi:bifunctional 4-hydroxy-2-oxoglutarate aldolase/2-dehydro-3-deoxy-phosphogluconate aldolase [Paracoccus sp. Z118]|uniref:bifunctional 4-hydroxy-2-oxoglutarate aldolase/2-dehydro-3-deoxy-phosphogluconate aldolase n=1 Tax=Paracoccus sp. Z118 TaxID=2851017 RepID=UPI001C2C80E0|nr:bifunctional 4-hydroxy-2-oxoglutarate aldolase/2-dehydro-3-deoxy-phosphogluconate aldolase [Paracoccus sp. Z118]MBV0891583.1 bifunctional 4-hydroxy-2-oxoglutarate aldolase/2-dehydro-3-deoxy-phosphogluconate aldolase [Paracoccus sp. Z118]
MPPETQSARMRQLCALAPVIPVLVITDAGTAPDLGRALVAGGLPVLEVTLRSDAALPAIRALSGLKGAHVGAGTVLSADDVARGKDAGATFAVSPGLTDAIARAAEDAGLPLLPGAATASEAMRARDLGYDMLKLFPAEAIGGAALLKALHGPLPQLSFCPTGGITVENAPRYLALPNVPCVGGSWIAPEADQRARDWPAIEARARAAAKLGQ